MQTATFQRLKEILKIEEGYSRFVYKDSRGIDTIGYGFALRDLDLSKDVCDLILSERLAKIEPELSKELPEYLLLDEVRQCTLLDLSYNIGVAGLMQFHDMIGALRAKNYTAAAAAMRNSLWYKEVGHRGEYLASLMENGKWQ